MEDFTKKETVEQRGGYDGHDIEYVNTTNAYIKTKKGRKQVYGGCYIMTFPNGDRTVVHEPILKLFKPVKEDLSSLFRSTNIKAEDVWKLCTEGEERPMEKAPHLTEKNYIFNCDSCGNSISSIAFVNVEEFEKFCIEHLSDCIKNRKTGIITDVGFWVIEMGSFTNRCPFCEGTNLEYDGIEEHDRDLMICQDIRCRDCHAELHVASNIEWDIIDMNEGITNLNRYRFVFKRGGIYLAHVIYFDSIVNDGNVEFNGGKKKFSDLLSHYKQLTYELVSTDKLLMIDDENRLVFENDIVCVREKDVEISGLISNNEGFVIVENDDGEYYNLRPEDEIRKISNTYTANMDFKKGDI